MSLLIGQPAPLFSLYNSEKKLITLEDYRGKTILLLFFPLAFTSVCTKELCSVRDNISWYENQDVQIFGISVDSLYTLSKYKQEQGLNFPLLSDFNKTVSKLYGSLHEKFSYDMEGVGKRSSFVIDKDGIIRYAEVLENASELPDFQSIEKIIGELEDLI
ncbi:MAG: peroxiredoxin [Chitinophagaceae bacterium]